MAVDPATAAMNMVSEIFKFSGEVLEYLKIDQRFGRELKKKIDKESEIREKLDAQLSQDLEDPANTRDDNLIAHLESDLVNIRLDIANYYSAMRVALKDREAKK